MTATKTPADRAAAQVAAFLSIHGPNLDGKPARKTPARKPTLAQVSAALIAQNEINASTGNPPVGKPHPAPSLWQAYNHNGTELMLDPGTEAQAQAELKEYEHQTGNCGGWIGPLSSVESVNPNAPIQPLAAELDLPPATGKPIPLSKVNPAVLDYFLELRKVAVAESITATAAIHRALDNFPQITRKDLKHAAAAAGINPLTARNTFDRIRSSAK